MMHAFMLTIGRTSAENLIYIHMELDNANFGTRNSRSQNIRMLAITVFTVKIVTVGKS